MPALISYDGREMDLTSDAIDEGELRAYLICG